MRRPARPLVALPALFLLAGCVGAPAPAETPITPNEACTALEAAVTDFYDIASPGSTVTALATYAVPVVNGLRVPRPDCAFEVRPDPQVVPGDVFTLENFYLDYDEQLTVTLADRLTDAGFAHTGGEFSTYSTAKLGHVYSAAVLLFSPDDGQPYSVAAERFRILDLTIGQH
ncbi:MAG: hypothetical protein AB7K08_00215 [Microbacteriaceae bacterium]